MRSIADITGLSEIVGLKEKRRMEKCLSLLVRHSWRALGIGRDKIYIALKRSIYYAMD